VKQAEWLGLSKTKATLAAMHIESDRLLREVLKKQDAASRDRQASIVLGFEEAINFILRFDGGKGGEEEDG